MGEPQTRAAGDGVVASTSPSGEGNAYTQSVEQRFLEHFGLSEQPFGVTPDPRFLYLGPQHRQALAALNYGTELNRGFLTLIAEPGMGKTTVLFNYLEGLRNKARTAFLFQTDCDPRDLMAYMLADMGIDCAGKALPEMHAILNQVLMEEMRQGRRFVLVIDEAQNLSEKALESVRLLSNFETPWMKLMQIVLAGQPQLAERLAKPSMAQLRQRVSFAIRIEPFTREEVDLYLDHRLWVAGYKGAPLFSVGARTLIAERSEGIPRVINNMCFCAMSFAWAMKRKAIDRDTMSEVLDDLDPGSPIEKVEKEALPPKLQGEPKPSVSQMLQPVGLILESPPARGWFSKSVVVVLVLIALGWLGLQLNVEKWIGSSANSISIAVRSFLVPTSAAVSPDPASTVAPDNSSTSPKLEGPSDVRDMKVPHRDGVDSSSLGGGHD